MRKLASTQCAVLLIALACGFGLSAALGTTQEQQSTRMQKVESAYRQIDKRLRDFAQAAEDNDLEAALKLFATEEDLKVILSNENARKSAREIRSRVKLHFHEYVEALKDFGKHDLFKVYVGKIRQLDKDEQEAERSAPIVENGYISFARDTNVLIELRFNVGGVMRVNPDRWVLVNMKTRADEGE